MKKQVSIATTDDLRLRVAVAKTVIREKGLKNYLRVFIDKYKKYDNLDSISELTAVFQLRKANEKITKEIEAFVNELQHS